MMLTIILLFLLLIILGVVIHDLVQTKHAILRNFPLVGHFRYWLESIGPELRQYIVTSNTEERPFSRDQRRWAYASSKKENNYFGFGTSEELERSPNYLIIKHSQFPLEYQSAYEKNRQFNYAIPCAKILGKHRNRKKMFRPESIVNISGLSYGSLSGPAIEALNKGALAANCFHNTGEGGVSPHHRHNGELIWQIGTGYFGCRNERGNFDINRLCDVIDELPVRAIEIKLSQGAKPGAGGILPARKVTKEISKIRGIPMGKDCISPAAHSAFHDVDSLLDFVEKIAEATGLPVGIKSAVGQMKFWTDLATMMSKEDRGVDFITIDGGEGGTGAGPLVFTDHVAFPFKVAFTKVYQEFAKTQMDTQVVFIGSGKLGFPENALLAIALGCDLINVGREAMFAIGCIQAQRCHTNHCPTGVATQSKWLMRGLDPTHKAARLANYIVTLRKEVLNVAHACGVIHPALLSSDHMEIINDKFGLQSIKEVFNYENTWGLPSSEDQHGITKIMQESLNIVVRH
jgi:glutamate synthase domain-containing protein 2